MLAGLCFALPFVTVSCDVPGGYGRANAGGTSSYTGIDLATGGAPDVPDSHRREPEVAQDDRFTPQPLVIVAGNVILAGAAAAAIRVARTRRAVATAAAVAAGIALITAETIAHALIEVRLREQLAVPLPAGKVAADYVRTGNGFVVCLLLLVVLAAANGIALWRARSPGPATSEAVRT